MIKSLRFTFLTLCSASTLLVGGGDLVEPVEPAITIPKKDIVIINDDNVKYDGWYGGISYSYLSMNEAVLASGHGATLVAGYYFSKYFGVEVRYTTTLDDITIDNGPTTSKRNDTMQNIAFLVKPIYNVTTGLAIYGLAGYGKSTYEKLGVEYSEEGVQYGIGAKYELSNGFGFYVDYLELYSEDNYDNTVTAQDLLFDAISIGTTYTF